MLEGLRCAKAYQCRKLTKIERLEHHEEKSACDVHCRTQANGKLGAQDWFLGPALLKPKPDVPTYKRLTDLILSALPLSMLLKVHALAARVCLATHSVRLQHVLLLRLCRLTRAASVFQVSRELTALECTAASSMHAPDRRGITHGTASVT